MNPWIGFFRGINVGGHNVLPMKELKSVLEGIGCSDVATYIQSGNVVFTSTESRADVLRSNICRAVHANFGFEPCVLLLSVDQLIAAMVANPFQAAQDEPKTLHLYFLADEANDVDWNGLESRKSDTEQYRLTGRVFYLHAPDGIGRSKLAAKVEKLLGVPATARNWRTVDKVLQLVR
jgi:uncharacterized protein (DUF1697 family)